MKYTAIVLASGKGLRANLGFNKVFYVMKDGKRVIDHSLELFNADADCERIVVVTTADYLDQIDTEGKVVTCTGGQERKDSVRLGLEKTESEYVFVHDAARPFVLQENLEELKKTLAAYGTAVLGHMAADTIKEVEGDRIICTLDRTKIFQAETPQCFRTELLKHCYDNCEDVIFTDDSSLVESLGYEVHVVLNEYDNRKLTREDDFKQL